jgi:hypothetical protein
LQQDGGWVVCRVFKKNKNLKVKVQERATVSYEDSQMGLLPEPIGSPDILSGDARFAYAGAPFVKREIINLDEYQHQPSQVRSYLTRALSLKRPEDVNFFMSSYQDGCEYNNDPQTSDHGNEDSTISGLENVDWNSLLQEPVVAKSETPAVMGGDRDMTILLQLKRQNSDLFSSLDLWNYSQVAQQM